MTLGCIMQSTSTQYPSHPREGMVALSVLRSELRCMPVPHAQSPARGWLAAIFMYGGLHCTETVQKDSYSPCQVVSIWCLPGFVVAPTRKAIDKVRRVVRIEISVYEGATTLHN